MKLTRLLPEDYPVLKPFFKDQAYRLCFYSLPSAIAWSNEEYHPFKRVIDNAVVIGCEFSNKKENRHLLLPVSPDRELTPEELKVLAGELGFDSFWCVPEDYIETYSHQRVAACFTVTEQNGYSDYIYRTQDLMNLKGNKYSKKRNLVHQFERKVLEERDVVLEDMTPASLDECLRFMDIWCQERNCNVDEDSDLACEKEAVRNTIEHMEAMDVTGLMLKIDGEVSAFGMASYLTNEMGVLHFEKALARIKGLYQYFDKQCATRLLKDYRYTNKENDMEIPGLARAKKSYHPAMMVRSYRLVVR